MSSEPDFRPPTETSRAALDEADRIAAAQRERERQRAATLKAQADAEAARLAQRRDPDVSA